jgi:hypothetical protein
MTQKTKRVLSEWSSYADAHAWAIVGTDIKRQVANILGDDKTNDIQFGNILGWLRDRGEHDLATDIRQRIAEYNGVNGPRDY